MPTQYDPGIYKFLVKNQGFSEAKTTKNPQFFLQGEPFGQIDAESGQVYEVKKHTRTITWTITDRTIDRVIEELQSLGWEGTKFSQLDPSNQKCFSFVGKEIDVECKHEPGQTDQSKLYEKWELPFEGSGPKESLATVGSKLDALFGAKLMNKNGGKKTQAAAASRKAEVAAVNAANGGEENDPIPF